MMTFQKLIRLNQKMTHNKKSSTLQEVAIQSKKYKNVIYVIGFFLRETTSLIRG